MENDEADASDIVIGFAAATTPKSDLKSDELPLALSVQASAPPFFAAVSPSAPPYAEIDFRVTAAPAHAVPTPGAIHKGQWAANLCDCCHSCVPNCCMATFCPCVLAAQIASRVDLEYHKVLIAIAIIVVIDLFLIAMAASKVEEDNDGYYYSDGHYTYAKFSDQRITAWAYAAETLFLVPLAAYWYLRVRVRRMYNLQGGCADDCWTACLYSCCALAQMATHVKSYKPGSCDFGPPDELAAYSA